jgi:cyanophycinase-like exopeptidase
MPTVVMTMVTDQPQESGEDYREAFQELGVTDIRVVDVSRLIY